MKILNAPKARIVKPIQRSPVQKHFAKEAFRNRNQTTKSAQMLQSLEIQVRLKASKSIVFTQNNGIFRAKIGLFTQNASLIDS
jgi:hypothetical protein